MWTKNVIFNQLNCLFNWIFTSGQCGSGSRRKHRINVCTKVTCHAVTPCTRTVQTTANNISQNKREVNIVCTSWFLFLMDGLKICNFQLERNKMHQIELISILFFVYTVHRRFFVCLSINNRYCFCVLNTWILNGLSRSEPLEWHVVEKYAVEVW